MPTPTAIRTALTLGLTASGAFAGIGLALSLGTIPLLLLAPAPTLLAQWRALYRTGLWIGPPGAVTGAACLGFAAWATRRREWERLHGDDARAGKSWESAGEGVDEKKGGRGGGRAGKWKPLALAATSCAAIVPFTWAFLAGTSEVLLRESSASVGRFAGKTSIGEGVLRGMIVRWGWVCAVRALLPLGGTMVGVWSVVDGG